jgi:HAD superfamily hydrolase (TIGR01509 family)
MAERPRLDAVVFDAGGTLLRLDFEWMAEQVGALGTPLGAEALRRAEIAGRRAYDRSRGHARRDGEPHPPLGTHGDTRAYFGGMLEAAGVEAPAREAVIGRWFARQLGEGLWTRPMEGARDALDGLSALGMRCACVSNSDGRAEWHLEQCGVRAGLEFVVDSQLVGVEKPDPAIFRIALGRLGVAPGHALYVGDIRSVDEAGSRAAAMHFVLIDPYGDYGEAGIASLARIEQLPGWLPAHFEIGRTGSRVPR